MKITKITKEDVGREVYSKHYGKGIIIKYNAGANPYPVHVKFENSDITEVFTSEGVWFMAINSERNITEIF